MFSKMPVILIGLIILSGILQPWIPLSLMEIFYAISLTLKSFIVFFLPFIIFGLLFKTAIQFSKKGSLLVLALLLLIMISNYFSTLISYSVGSLIYNLRFAMPLPTEDISLNPAWLFEVQKLIPNDIAMFLGLGIGLGMGRFFPKKAEELSRIFEKGVNLLLKGIIGVIPVFILGFVLKMQYDNVLAMILYNFTLIFAVIGAAVYSYVAFLYLAASRFQKDLFLSSIKNMIPAAITGFGSMSSAAAMPLTLIGTEKNSKNPDMARSIIPATVNIHLIGDCFAIPIFAFAVMKNFGMPEPTLIAYLIFAVYFVLAKFSVAAVPGGGILVMLPILESQLGFNAEMLSLITALYILFDPVITAANILGNGAFATILSNAAKETRFLSAKSMDT